MSYYKIRPRSGTATQWATANPILAEREIGYEVPATGFGTGPVRLKMGDGVTPWNNLPYADPETGGSGEDCLTKADIVNNAETDNPNKVASASALKSVADSLKNVGLKVDTLFSGNLTNSNTATLSNSISNYKMLVVEWQKTADANDGMVQEFIVNPTIGIKYSSDGGAYSGSNFYHSCVAFAFTDATTIHYNWHSHNKYSTDAIIKKVYGIK